MAIQSRRPAFLLTRPAAQSHRFATSLRQRFGNDIAITISPLIAPSFIASPLPAGPVEALIFTSETGVAAYMAHAMRPDTLPKRAYCVGNRTAKAAALAGLEPISADGDAVALIALICAQRPSGRLLHICGEQTRGAVAEVLTKAGIPAEACILYRQAEQPLTKPAIALLQGKTPVLAPLFSPRSATLFRKQVSSLGPLAPLICVVLSKAVGDTLSGLEIAKLWYADRPTAESLLAAIEGFYPPA
ncbi:uroporphyrinogen-III synthase [Pseudorhodobacter sp.]|uniref:uroporphyrinogen-III synthase n=1 Tax=Pseudorhodobacter sp. TaxID=1934400 RepID=UPI002AFDCDB4|nr:uroporphyrinogen-III synthase [Pseudorhodobacter sp.]